MELHGWLNPYRSARSQYSWLNMLIITNDSQNLDLKKEQMPQILLLISFLPQLLPINTQNIHTLLENTFGSTLGQKSLKYVKKTSIQTILNIKFTLLYNKISFSNIIEMQFVTSLPVMISMDFITTIIFTPTHLTIIIKVISESAEFYIITWHIFLLKIIN